MANPPCEETHGRSLFFSKAWSLGAVALLVTATSSWTRAYADTSASNRSGGSSRCRSLSLFESAATPAELKPLYETIAAFEKAFHDNDNRLFRKLVHPALSRERQNPEIFASTVQEFGLEKAKLQRNAIFLLDIPQNSNLTTAQCSGGEIRGVVGLNQQFGVMHSFAGGNEQIKVFSLIAPVAPSLQAKQGAEKHSLGIVMLHAQVWTHGKLAPAALLTEARKWTVLNDPIAAWAYAAAAERILAANPYFISDQAQESTRVAADAKAKLPSFEPLRASVKEFGGGWEFIDLAVIFQAKSLEVGAKFRMKSEEPVNSQIEKCKSLGLSLAREFPSLTKRFSGYECMPYATNEKLDDAPDAGSQFHTWKELASQAK